MASSPPSYLQKSISRRVSFNEASIVRRRRDSDTESQSRAPTLSPIYRKCCFWTTLILGFLFFLLIIFGGMYYAFVRSNIPDVRFQKLDVSKIDVVSNSTATFLTAEIVAYLNATNGNGKAELGYRSMTARMSSVGIEFGESKIEDVNQAPLTSASLNVTKAVTNLTVEQRNATELQEKVKIRMLVIDLRIWGRIEVHLGGKRISSFPFKIECLKIDEKEVDLGHAPKCISQLTTPLR